MVLCIRAVLGFDDSLLYVSFCIGEVHKDVLKVRLDCAAPHKLLIDPALRNNRRLTTS